METNSNNHIRILVRKDIKAASPEEKQVEAYIALRNHTYAEKIAFKQQNGSDPNMKFSSVRRHLGYTHRVTRNSADPAQVAAKLEEISTQERKFDDNPNTVFAIATDDKGEVTGGIRFLVSPEGQDNKLDFETGKSSIGISELLGISEPAVNISYGQIGGMVTKENASRLLAGQLMNHIAEYWRNRPDPILYVVSTVTNENVINILHVSNDRKFQEYNDFKIPKAIVSMHPLNFAGDKTEIIIHCMRDDKAAMQTLDRLVENGDALSSQDYQHKHRTANKAARALTPVECVDRSITNSGQIGKT